MEKKLAKDRLEQALIQALRSRGGRVTPMEIAADVGLNLSAAEDELDRLVEEGHGRTDLTEDIRKVYVFPAFEKSEPRITPPPAPPPPPLADSQSPGTSHDLPEPPAESELE